MIKKFKKPAMIIAAAVVVAKVVGRVVARKRMVRRERELMEKADRKKAEVKVSVEMSRRLPEVDQGIRQKILKKNIAGLQKGLGKGKYTCEDIFLSFNSEMRDKAFKHNAVVDVDIDYGLRRARKLDAELKAGKKRSELHGIPISVKDFIAVKNMMSSYGCASLSYSKESADAYLVKVLKKKGAVIYIKSSMSQNAESYETISSVSGTTTNPLDPLKSAGGSSGGEAVLVATRGTCLGLGTDIGGSLRFPAMSCGIFSLKPTSSRLSRNGPQPLNDLPMKPNSWGPLSNNIDDLVLFCQVVFNEKPFPTLPFIPFNTEAFSNDQPLTIAFCLGCDYWPVASSMLRAIKESTEVLSGKGHRVVEYIIDDEIKEAIEVTTAIESYDLRNKLRLDGEKPLKVFRKSAKVLSTPVWLRKFYEKVVKYRYGEKESYYYKEINQGTAYELDKSINRARVLKRKVFGKLQKLQADILLFPYAFPAIPHEKSPDLMPGFGYMALFNLLDIPVGSVPVGIVTENELEYQVDSKEIWAEAMKEVVKGSLNLPISVQVAGLPFREEQVLRIMKELSILTNNQ